MAVAENRFLGAWFFAIMAPTSSVVPVATQTIAEHRMYLALAAVATGSVAAGYLAGQWFVRRGNLSPRTAQFLGGLLVLAAAVALGVLTFHRNQDYRSDLSIWEDAAAKMPGNARTHHNLAMALRLHDRPDDAIAEYGRAIEFDPAHAETHSDMGLVLAARGRWEEAIAQFRKALEIRPSFAEAHTSLGAALAGRGETEEAITQFRKALAIRPNDADTLVNLGMALCQRRRFGEAIAPLEQALRIAPNDAEARRLLGRALLETGQVDEAIAHGRTKVKSDDVKARQEPGDPYRESHSAGDAHP